MILSQQDSQAEKFLKDREIMVWPAPDGYAIRVNNRGGMIPFRIEEDEMDEIHSITRILMSEISRIEKEEKERKRFLTTDRLFPKRGGYVCITPGLPTPR
jgi:hypothetical protein